MASNWGSTAGSAAEAPQTDSPMPASRAARTVVGTALSNSVSDASAGRSADRSRRRTSAVRSFVPMEKKSTLPAKAGAAAAVAASSTIMASGGGAGPAPPAPPAPARDGGPGRGRGGELNHHAEWRRVDAGRLGRPGQLDADEVNLLERAHHRDHDRQAGARAGLEDRRELGGDGAGGAQERGQARRAGERRDLVAAEVEQPDDRALAAEQPEHRGERGQVPGAVRPAGRGSEGDLGAQQADAGRAVGQAEAGLRGRGDVAQDRHELAVGGAPGS